MNHPKEMLAGKKRAKKGTKLNDYYMKSKWQNNLIENDVRYKKKWLPPLNRVSMTLLIILLFDFTITAPPFVLSYGVLSADIASNDH